MGIASLDSTSLKDQPCVWHGTTLCGTPKTRAYGFGSLEIDREHPHVVNSVNLAKLSHIL